MTGAEACADCGRQVRLRGRTPQGRICSNCASIRNSAVCSRCGQQRRIAGIDPTGGRWCERCRNRHRRHTGDNDRRALVVAAVRQVEPHLAEDDVLAAAARAATSRRALRWLADHLAAHPQVLEVGPNSTLKVLDRLIGELTVAGAIRLTTIHPVCAGCDQRKRIKAHGRCAACVARASRRPCVECGAVRRPYRRDDHGQVVCVGCVRAGDRNDELDRLAVAIGDRLAALLGPIDPAVVVVVLDEVVAQPHRRRQLHDQLDTVEAWPRLPTTALTARLAAGLAAAGVELPPAPDPPAPPPTSTMLPTTAPTARLASSRAAAGVDPPRAPDPPAPSPAPVALHPLACADCGGPAEPLVTYRGIVRCRPCAKICPQCDRPTKDPRNPLCYRCRPDPDRPIGTCADCHRPERRLDRNRRCRGCRERQDHRCARCDQITALTATSRGWLCHRCMLTDEIDTVLAGDSDNTFAPLRDAIIAADNPQRVRLWLARPTITGLLVQLASGRLPLDHTSLDTAPARGTGIAHLRALLVAAGLLDDLDRTDVRFQAHAATTLDAITDPADQTIVRTWVTWQVLPRLRQRADRGQPVIHSAANARHELSKAVTFLARLHGCGRTLADCRQDDIDHWFAQPGAAPRQLRAFLAWAQRHRHLPRHLDLPTSQSRAPAPPTGDRATLARRLLTDPAIADDDRVAGALVVFYAQPVTRIATLTTGDLHVADDDTVAITLAGTPIELIEPFAGLARQLPLPRTNGVADQLPTPWLFPGKLAGRHIHHGTLGNRLRALGIPPRLSRATALAELAVELPPAILAELVGIHPGTAARWAAITGGDWASYPSARPSPTRP